MTAIHISPKLGCDHQDEVLRPPALHLMKHLAERFVPLVRFALDMRRRDQEVIDGGILPSFPKGIRELSWKCPPPPEHLVGSRRRVELTGPATQKGLVNGLNSGADVFMADLEDSLSPTWNNIIYGHLAIRAAVGQHIDFHDTESGKNYSLNDQLATLMVRPRGLHLVEPNVTFDGEPIPAAIFDLASVFFHCREVGRVPDLYLPKIQDRLEANIWNQMIACAEAWLEMPVNQTKVTVLIETFPAIFQVDEIVYELRDRIVALNCGRWDYLFSSIKTLRNHPTWVLPDRDLLSMEQPCMRAYAHLVVQTCRRRGIVPIGGMAAQIPLKDPDDNALALAEVVADKNREISQGFQGTWVAHPGLVPVARAVMEKLDPLPGESTYVPCALPPVLETDLLRVPHGDCTYAGLEKNVRVACQYIDSWLKGKGCVVIDGLMEDMATAEISRSQVWQWVKQGYFLSGTVMDIVDKQPVSELAQAVFMTAALSGSGAIPSSIPEFLSTLALHELDQD